MKQTLPITRSESVVVQEHEKETLIYDFTINKAYCLNETSSIVYRHCDGKTSFDELKRRYQYTDDLIFLALDELQKNNLIESEKITHFAEMNRREVIKKVGLGTLAALPVISALSAPSAANAASGCAANGQTCTFNNFTQSNCCLGQRCESVTGNTCRSCLTTGFSYYQTGDGGTPSQTTCNTTPERNRCCNTTATPTVSGSDCLCP